MILILHVETISDLIWVCILGLASGLHFWFCIASFGIRLLFWKHDWVLHVFPEALSLSPLLNNAFHMFITIDVIYQGLGVFIYCKFPDF